MILGARFLFITALADKTHYIIQLEEKFSAAACVARGGGLFKKKNQTDFCFILSGQFSFQLLQNCTLKGFQSGKEKGSAQQF